MLRKSNFVLIFHQKRFQLGKSQVRISDKSHFHKALVHLNKSHLWSAGRCCPVPSYMALWYKCVALLARLTCSTPVACWQGSEIQSSPLPFCPGSNLGSLHSSLLWSSCQSSEAAGESPAEASQERSQLCLPHHCPDQLPSCEAHAPLCRGTGLFMGLKQVTSYSAFCAAGPCNLTAFPPLISSWKPVQTRSSNSMLSRGGQEQSPSLQHLPWHLAFRIFAVSHCPKWTPSRKSQQAFLLTLTAGKDPHLPQPLLCGHAHPRLSLFHGDAEIPSFNGGHSPAVPPIRCVTPSNFLHFSAPQFPLNMQSR